MFNCLFIGAYGSGCIDFGVKGEPARFSRHLTQEMY